MPTSCEDGGELTVEGQESGQPGREALQEEEVLEVVRGVTHGLVALARGAGRGGRCLVVGVLWSGEAEGGSGQVMHELVWRGSMMTMESLKAPLFDPSGQG